jgi:serine/threonine-protein kinase
MELAISPDGNMLAFVGERDRTDHLYLRRLGQLQAVPLVPGPVSEPFFSPDGQWVGFFSIADRKLKKVPVAGGNPVPICDIYGDTPRGASWGDDDVIVFNAFGEPWTQLLRVSAAGGTPAPVTTLSEGEVSHRWPQVLPGAKAALFSAFGTQGGIDASNVVVQRLPAGPPKVVLRGAHYARYRRSGHLVYAQGATLFAIPFDVNRLEVAGQPVAIVQGVMAFKMSGASVFDVSDRGTLAYVARRTDRQRRSHHVDAPRRNRHNDASEAARLESPAVFTRWTTARVPCRRRAAAGYLHVRMGT